MKTGDMLIGQGEVGRDGLAAMSEDDLNRNRNRNIIPRFFTVNIKKAEGGFEEKEYLELLIPGDSKSAPCHLVDDRLRQQYAPHYKAFKENLELPTEGTAVETWLGANDSRVHMLRSLHLRTVEMVAEMNDNAISAVGIGGRELKLRAAKFLEVQEGSRTADELAGKDNLILELASRLAKLENPEASDEDAQASAEALIAANGSGIKSKPSKGKGKGK